MLTRSHACDYLIGRRGVEPSRAQVRFYRMLAKRAGIAEADVEATLSRPGLCKSDLGSLIEPLKLVNERLQGRPKRR